MGRASGASARVCAVRVASALGAVSRRVRAFLLLPGERWTVGQVAAVPLLVLVRAYQLLISPLTPPSCRFYPCCSSYAVTALGRFGPLRGSWLVARRLLRCNPWNPGGTDHVPHREGAMSATSARSHPQDCPHGTDGSHTSAPGGRVVTDPAYTTP